jgi:uncharacterized protein (TIGR02391 family)
MQAAIPKIQRRIKELESLDPNNANEIAEPTFSAVAIKIDDTLVELFGRDTVEYERFNISSLYEGPFIMGGTPLHEVRQGYRDGIERAKSTLNTLIELFREKIEDSGLSPEAKATSVFSGLALHSEVERATSSLFRDGHYANAIEDACKVLDALVKMRSGKFDLSGTELMQAVFSPKSPALRFNDGVTETEKSEQQGMMFLYAGAMLAFRNPRAHGIIDDDVDTAVEVISFVSFLARELDKARKS